MMIPGKPRLAPRGRGSRSVLPQVAGQEGLPGRPWGLAPWVAAACLALGSSPPWALAESSIDQVETVTGAVTSVSTSAVEVAGHRGAITGDTFLVSDGRPIALNSIRNGMAASMELDPAGRALQVDVKGVVE